MGNRLRISGVPAYDGEYSLDFDAFTMRDLHKIKEIAGVRAGELDDALGAGDTDVLVALAVIAMERSGRTVDVDGLWDAETLRLEIVTDEQEGDAGPPDGQRASSGSSANDTTGGGAGSRSGGGRPVSVPSRTGVPS